MRRTKLLYLKIKYLLCVLTLVAYSSCVQSQTSCENINGTCKSIYECEPLLLLLKKEERSSQDIETLKKSQCGKDGNVPLVCCPSQCFTPERNPGYCMDIYQCPSLSNLLTPPILDKSMRIIEAFRCEGENEFSVCCSDYGQPETVQPTNLCELTATPPDPRTECCGIETNKSYRIFEGSRTSVDMYPWLAAIEYNKDNKTKILCGAALISGKYLLTAGHCITGLVLTVGIPTNIRLGEYDITNDGPDCVVNKEGSLDCTDEAVIIPIERTIPHPNYDPGSPSKRNDIGLLRLSQTAPYTDFIRPICLPNIDRTINPPKDFSMFVAGWGAVNASVTASNVKRHVALPFKTLESCQPAYNTRTRNVSLWRGHVCAGGVKGQDTCKGDTGAPLAYQFMENWEVIGITSFGPFPCGLEGVPGVYTNVFQYIPWINSQITP